MDVVLPDDLIREIITWLPTKSLMRFKAVSKLWLSTILDPGFAKAHRASLQGLLIMCPSPNPHPRTRYPTSDFFCLNLDDAYGDASSIGSDFNSSEKGSASDFNCSEAEVDVSFQFSVPDHLRTFGVTNLVNGLVCFFKRNVAKLCNIATREIIELPDSTCAYNYSTYHLGFDPTSKLYKILKICPFYFQLEGVDELDDPDIDEGFVSGDLDVGFDFDSIECEILTLGVDSSWRSIYPPPPTAIRAHCSCINGVLYWLMTGGRLISFNMAKEKFESILVDTRPYLCGYSNLGTGYSIALADYDPDSRTIHRRKESDSWTKMHKYILPYRLDVDGSFFPKEVLPNGVLVIYSDFGASCFRSENYIYLFDEIKRDLQKIVFKQRPSALPKMAHGRISWYKENIISLRCLVDCWQPA